MFVHRNVLETEVDASQGLPLSRVSHTNMDSKRPVDAPPQPTDCAVCCEKFSLAVRKRIDCPNCDYIACAACNKTYLTSVDDPQCMSCKHPFDREFIDMNFAKAWVGGEYLRHRGKVLLDREVSQLPASQHLVKNYRTRTALRQRLREEAEEKIRLQMRLRTIENNRWVVGERVRRIEQSKYQNNGRTGSGESDSERTAFVRRCPVEECRGFLSTALKCGVCDTFACAECHEAIGAQRDAAHTCNPETVATVKLLKKDSKNCPSCQTIIHKIDGCFAADVPILMWDGTAKMAPGIRVGDVLIGDDHRPRHVLATFNGEDAMFRVEQDDGATYTVNSKHTLALMAHELPVDITVEEYIRLPDTAGLTGVRGHLRPGITVTPCGRGRYYGWCVDGNKRFLLPDATVVRNCDQMFCTSCHTAFSWRTGEVARGIIHNPHYFEWQRRMHDGAIPRQPGDDPCELTVHTIRTRMAASTNADDDPAERDAHNRAILYAMQRIAHIRGHELGYGYVVPGDDENIDLRRRFLMDDISEDEWKRQLRLREKRKEKIIAIRHALELLTDASQDIFRGVSGSVDSMKQTLDQFEQLCAFAGGALARVSNRFNCKTPAVPNVPHIMTTVRAAMQREKDIADARARRNERVLI